MKFLESKYSRATGVILLFALFWTSSYYFSSTFFSPEIHSNVQLWTARISALSIVFYSISIIRRNGIDINSNALKSLSLLRICFFSLFTIGLPFQYSHFYDRLSSFIVLESTMRTDVIFMNWLPDFFPESGLFIHILLIAMWLGALLCLLGYKTKYAGTVFLISAFFVFGIPNFYGKIDHNHHLIWFAFLIAFSPSDKYWSMNADEKSHLNQKDLKDARSYLSALWLCIALIYFFPGFWKLWKGGLEWIYTDNLKWQLYNKWNQLGDWLPFFRIDHYPFLVLISALFTILFELFFLVLILKKETRAYGVIAGILFHIGTLVFMKIFFVVILLMYLGFYEFPVSEKSANERPVKRFSYVLILPIILIVFGFAKWNSWPFSVYPTFDSTPLPYQEELKIEIKKANGSTEKFDDQKLQALYGSARWSQMEKLFISGADSVNMKSQMKEIIEIIEVQEKYESISAWIIRKSIIPEKKDSLIYSKHIYSMKLQP